MGLVARLQQSLGSRTRTVIENPDAVACGVLVAIIPNNDDYSVLYILRSESLPNHRGQVAFPGGKHSRGDDSLRDTALREAHEEVGILPADVQILGLLDDVYTMATDYVITPYIGLLRAGYRFTANPGEVDEIFTVSLSDLVNPEHHKDETKSFKGNQLTFEAITAGPHDIWGATHRITINLLDVLSDAAGAA
jgi:8-oxo-dGTP pyrophosphatase MutT (NUDIX family)